MPSRKQEIYCELLQWGILHLRLLCGAGEGWTTEKRFHVRDACEIGWEEANFLHRVHVSILEPEYVDNDISFINWAFPAHIERLGNHLWPEVAKLMLEFYEGVPHTLRPQITWHPTEEFKQLVMQGT